ncbi:DUF669 domain-containing protein [Staphylococcus condimenti]|uniref:DUF669 domain-containing protein n=1 Tax=Staphylococcus condimenti TaxID=70255 RepID=A0A4Q7CQH2_9STAP|nr:DUF669 domain-containing protein [Staphylococcus condimenti]RZI03062.1 DUF669 domain-containing protein [Staphylococcus condimenti]
MTNFTLNMEDTFDGGIQDGTYEAVITKSEENATPGGAEHVDMRLTIRNDIDQKYKNNIIFHKIWKSKKTDKYDLRFFNTIGAAAQLQQGKQYSSIEELFKDFLGKPVRVTVKNETSEYNGKTYENLNVKRFEKTKFPELAHKFKTEDGGNPFAGVDTNDTNDNYPF